MSKYTVSGLLQAKVLRTPDSFVIHSNKWRLTDYKNAGICYIDALGEQIIKPEFSYDETNQNIEVHKIPLPEIGKNIRRKWKVCVYYEEDGDIIYKRLGNRALEKKIQAIESDAQSQAFRYWDPIYEYSTKGNNYYVVPYLTKNGRLGLMNKRKERLLFPIVKAKLISCSLEESVLQVHITVKKKEYVPGNIVLVLRTEKKNKEQSIQLNTVVQQREDGRYDIQGEIDLAGQELHSVYWDVVLSMYRSQDMELPEEQRDVYYVNAYNTSQNFKDQFLRLRQEVAYRTKDNHIFFPFVTKKETLAFKYREVLEADSFWFRLKERIAKKVYLTWKDHWDQKNIYLVYEKYCMCAQDNGFYFFTYCMNHLEKAEKNATFYYVIDKSSPDYDNVKQYKGRVIPFLSLKHMIYIQAAKLLISTDSKPHSYAWRQKGSILYETIMEKKNVFLQHGVIGLKNITKLYHKDANAGCDLFIASSAKEKEIIHDKLKYPNKDIVVTGLARWDVLRDKSSEKREILVMPTWRSWLDSVSDKEFCESRYFRHYENLLVNPELLSLLEEKDMYVTFYLHPIVRKYIADFDVKSDRVRLVAFGEESLNEIMMHSRLMITDYSSASWDMFYMKKPVVFYQFDAEDYQTIHGSYMNFDTDLFGDRADTIEDIITYLKKYEANGFTMDAKYENKWAKAFAYIDEHNSERILKAIMKMK